MRTFLCLGAAALVAAQLAGCASKPLPPPVTTASGLVYQSIEEGSGASPMPTDVVRVRYRGTFADGREFDSSRNAAVEFPLNRVIKCWTEGLQLMKPGGKAELVCPPEIAYGEKGAGNGAIPPNATLLFEVELLGVVRR